MICSGYHQMVNLLRNSTRLDNLPWCDLPWCDLQWEKVSCTKGS